MLTNYVSYFWNSCLFSKIFLHFSFDIPLTNSFLRISCSQFFPSNEQNSDVTSKVSPSMQWGMIPEKWIDLVTSFMELMLGKSKCLDNSELEMLFFLIVFILFLQLLLLERVHFMNLSKVSYFMGLVWWRQFSLP